MCKRHSLFNSQWPFNCPTCLLMGVWDETECKEPRTVNSLQINLFTTNLHIVNNWRHFCDTKSDQHVNYWLTKLQPLDILLSLMNGFNETEAAISYAGYASCRLSLFLSWNYIANGVCNNVVCLLSLHNGTLYCQRKANWTKLRHIIKKHKSTKLIFYTSYWD